MLDPNVIAPLQAHLQESRIKQSRLISRLRDLENEAALVREEIAELENNADQMTSTIDTLLGMMGSGGRNAKAANKTSIETEFSRLPDARASKPHRLSTPNKAIVPGRHSGSVTYLNQNRDIPNRTNNMEPISHRFADRTITQACTLLLREAGVPLHVNELYNLLVAGGMEFKGNNPTISVAVSLNRNRRFRKVDPGTFDLVMREASQSQAAS
ncbi:MAG: hypothetical protein WBD27_14115 [Pyrinomonadaceae bacterium]